MFLDKHLQVKDHAVLLKLREFRVYCTSIDKSDLVVLSHSAHLDSSRDGHFA